ncbi:hypothetical protein [Cloacibacillus evryensis]|uniref:hypothetical protein n=1 Tax=Cloacibacillus evryensis TaxID=508460 RepID=UPI0026E0F228|nr:hypothetical protein [Cloacibacillus evryensis]
MTRLIIPGGEIKIKGGDHAGAVIPFYNVSFNEDGRHPIFWGESEPDAGWLICDGGDDLNGGTVPNLSDKFILGTTDVTKAKETGGANTTDNATVGGTIGGTVAGGTVAAAAAGGTVGATTLAVSQMPSHAHGGFLYSGSGYNAYTTSNYNAQGTTGAQGGSGSHTHSFSGASHSHGFTGASHGHTFTGSAHSHTTTPPYYKLVYCVKLPE